MHKQVSQRLQRFAQALDTWENSGLLPAIGADSARVDIAKAAQNIRMLGLYDEDVHMSSQGDLAVMHAAVSKTSTMEFLVHYRLLDVLFFNFVEDPMVCAISFMACSCLTLLPIAGKCSV